MGMLILKEDSQVSTKEHSSHNSSTLQSLGDDSHMDKTNTVIVSYNIII